MKKLIFVFSGASGAGKSTLINYLLENLGCAGLTVSHTTRKPREGEKDGVNYHYVTFEQFENMIKNDEFIEYVKCFNNYYGTSKQAIEDVLRNNDICILDLEYEGAYKLLSNNIVNTKCVGILILAPSIRTLRQRLVERKSETKESLNTRINESFNVNRIAKYNHVIINNELDKTKKQLLKCVENYFA